MNIISKARSYYSRKDIQKTLLEFSRKREVAFNFNGRFGKRPDTLEYENDFQGLIEKGVTSFHCSEELWSNPLELKTDMTKEEFDSLRIGWDLIIDIDSKFLDYSKIAAKLMIEALKFHNISSIGIKYSGNKGFHIGVPWSAFPSEINGIRTEILFPELPRIIVQYLSAFIKNKLSDEMSKLQKNNYIKGIEVSGDFAKEVIPDMILVSPRHLFRAPYSLNEKSGLVSIVIKPEQLDEFSPGWAKPDRVYPKSFLPQAKKDEAKELVIQALDWSKKTKKEEEKKSAKIITIKDVSPETYPPCIKNCLQGIKEDGRKRALFILLNFLRSINLPEHEIKEKIEGWNKLNYLPLRSGYILSQLNWTFKHKTMLPPNCENSRYKELGICHPDFFCKKIKNPVNYIFMKNKLKEQEQNEKKSARKKV
ncbi:MAG: hypothetical protein QW041_00430 [Candidatus Pacearchaeota archaeon]